MQEKVCIVTAAADGMGQESARLLLQEGTRVMLVDRSEEKLAQARAALNAGDDGA